MKRKRRRMRERPLVSNEQRDPLGSNEKPLSSAERHKRWRDRHADQRRRVARIARLLIRRSHSDGHTVEAKLGWYECKYDAYFWQLALALADVLKTDKAIKQLKSALWQCLNDRKRAREIANWDQRMARWRARRDAQVRALAKREAAE